MEAVGLEINLPSKQLSPLLRNHESGERSRHSQIGSDQAKAAIEHEKASLSPLGLTTAP
jgi:hypothetical protein